MRVTLSRCRYRATSERTTERAVATSRADRSLALAKTRLGPRNRCRRRSRERRAASTRPHRLERRHDGLERRHHWRISPISAATTSRDEFLEHRANRDRSGFLLQQGKRKRQLTRPY